MLFLSFHSFVFSTRKRTTEVHIEIGKTTTCKPVIPGDIRRSKSVLDDDAIRELYLCLQRGDTEACQLVSRRRRSVADASPFAMPLREVLAAVEVSLLLNQGPCQAGSESHNPVLAYSRKLRDHNVFSKAITLAVGQLPSRRTSEVPRFSAVDFVM